MYVIGAVRYGTKEGSDGVNFWRTLDSYNIAQLCFRIVDLLLQVFALRASSSNNAYNKEKSMHAHLLL